MPKDRSSLCIGFNSNYSMKIRQYVLFKIKNLPTRKLHGERNHSFYSENVWGSLPQSWGLRICCLSYARDKTKRHLSLFLYWAQNLPSLLFYFHKWNLFLNNKLHINVPGKYHSAGCFPAIDEVRWTYWGLCCFHSTHQATDTFLWKRQTPQER